MWTHMQQERVSLPKSQTQLAQMDDDVFATSIVDRYSACPDSLNNMCLATFAMNYNVCYSISKDDIAGIEEADKEEEIDNDDIEHEKQFNIQPTITFKCKLGYMRKWKQEAILWTRRYKISTEPEKYYHSRLLLYYPWSTESGIITGFNSYQTRDNTYKCPQFQWWLWGIWSVTRRYWQQCTWISMGFNISKYSEWWNQWIYNCSKVDRRTHSRHEHFITRSWHTFKARLAIKTLLKSCKRETYQFSRVLHTHQVIKSGATSNSHVQQGMV